MGIIYLWVGAILIMGPPWCLDDSQQRGYPKRANWSFILTWEFSPPSIPGHLPKFYLNLLTLHHQTSSIYPAWWLSPTPLKNDGVRQLGLFFPTEWKVTKFHGSSHHQPVLNISHEQNIMFGYHKSPTDHSTDDQSFKIRLLVPYWLTGIPLYRS